MYRWKNAAARSCVALLAAASADSSAAAAPPAADDDILCEWAEISASDGAPDDAFGAGVSVWGDTAVVGAPNDDDPVANAGAAYVFQRDAGGSDRWGRVGQRGSPPTRSTATTAAPISGARPPGSSPRTTPPKTSVHRR